MRIKKSILTVNFFLAGMATAYLPACAAGQSIFQVVPTPNNKSNGLTGKDNGLFAVSASSPSDIWAVGQAIIHFDGATWTDFPAPGIDGVVPSEMNCVADISPTDAWAAGNVSAPVILGNGPSNQPVIEHWDGTQWSVFPSPPFNKQGDSAQLTGMAAISANDIWVLGNATVLGIGGNLFEHWDGTAWTPQFVPLGGGHLAVGAASADAANDVWGVGSSGLSSAQASTFVVHFDGTIWQSVPSPNVGKSSAFNGVAALAPNDVWAVGSSGDVSLGPTRTLIEHYDGSEWSVVPSPNVGPNSMFQSNRLFGITAVSPTDIWAFGSYFAADGSGNQMTLLLHWDGTSWTVAPSPDPEMGSILEDVLFAGVTTGNNVWIVGSQNPGTMGGAFIDTLAIHSTTAAGAGSN
jgi:hypothetical protein